MIGNDVIDLRDPETGPGAVHPRFDVRVFAPVERALLEEVGAEAARQLRWMLWAAKEAAYKAARRLDAGTVFSPRAFVVDRERREVRFRERRFRLSLDADDERVHALAVAEDWTTAPVSAVGPAGAEVPGTAARSLALRHLVPRLARVHGRLTIGRAGRIPTVEAAGRPLAVALSLSHHGRFVAFAAALPEPS